MPELTPPKPGRARPLLFLLALLAAAFAAPPAAARHGEWFNWHHEAASGTYYANTRIDGVGRIAWSYQGSDAGHGQTANSCRDIKYSVKSPSGGFNIKHGSFSGSGVLSSPITLTNSNGSAIAGNVNHIKVWHTGTNLTADVYTISIELETKGGVIFGNLACNPGTKRDIFFTITVAASPTWDRQNKAQFAATGEFSPVAVGSSSSRTPTGQTLHHSHGACRQISVGLRTGSSDAVELIAYKGSNTVDLDSVHMESDHADDSQVRIFFKAGATLTPGELKVTVVADESSSCSGATPGSPLHAEFRMTVATPASWASGGQHDAEAAADLKAGVLNAAGSDTWTGLAWHRTAAGCDARRVALESSSRTIFGLYAYNGGTRQGSLVNELDVTGSTHARVYLRGSHTDHVDATVQVSLSASGDCNIATRPANESFTWPVTVVVPAAWTLSGQDQLTPAREFSGPELDLTTAPEDTGIRIHRSSSACASTDVSLGGHADKLELYVHNAAGVRQGQSRGALADAVAMPANHVRLYFKAGVSITAPTTLEVTLSATADSSCTDPRTPDEASAATVELAISERAAWRPRTNDRATAPSGFSSYTLLDAAQPTATGIQIHRSSSACGTTDVALATDAPSYLGLDLHGGAVELTNSHAAVPMPGSGATDRHLRLYFRAGANVPDGVLLVTATLSASCAQSAILPRPQTVVYTLTVFTPPDYAWATLDEDSQRLRASSFLQSEIQSGTLATGIRLHRNSAECEATDVELLSSTEHLELVSYSAAGVADGAGAARLAAVPMSGNGDAADRHVRLRFQADAFPPGPRITAQVRVAPAASCASRRNPDPATFSYTLAITEDVDPPPVITITPQALVTIAADAAATGIRLAATDDDDDDVTFELEPSSRALWSLARRSAGVYDLLVRQGAALTRGARYTVVFIARDDNGELAERRGRVTVEIDDGAPVISLSAATLGLELNQGAAAATGLTISARDDDAANVGIEIDDEARRTFELRRAGGAHELWVSAGVTLVQQERFVVTIVATDAEGPGISRSSTATAVLTVRLGSGAATEAAAVDANAAALRAVGISGIDAVLNRPAPGAGPGPDAGTALLEMLAAKREGLESGEIDLREFLEGQAVSLPLSQNPADGGAGLGLWLAGGRSDVGGVTGEDDGAVYVEGSVSSSNFGVDARFGPVLAGLGYGLHKTVAEYGYESRRDTQEPSEYELDLQALQPYVAFDLGGARLALAAALGDGRLFLRPAGLAARERLDADYRGYAVGLVQRLPVFGAGELRLRGSYAASDLDVAEPEDGNQPSMDSEGSVLRMGLGYEHAISIGAASSVNPFFEAGYLLLGGDGATESSGLVSGGLAYVSGLLRANASYQQALGDEVTLEGYELSFRFSPRLGGLGLGLEADPGYGLADSEEMFAELGRGRKLALTDGDARGLRGGAGLSYGLAVDGGLLTPYGRWSVGAGRELGLRLQAGARRSWALGYGAADQELKIEYRLGD